MNCSFSQLKKSLIALPMMFFVLPASTNYQMHDFGFGAGGGSTGVSTNYGLTALVGESSGNALSSSNYSVGPGLTFTRQANVPVAPTVTNPSSYNNKLKIVIDTGGNPSDTTFALAISSDSFATTQYVKSDFSVGSTLTTADYLTYAGWGSSSGFLVTGLTPSTTYAVKVKALHKNFTETGYSAAGSGSTIGAILTFDLDVSTIDAKTAPPYILDIGTLSPGSTVTAGQKIWVDLDTNSASGAQVYLKGLQGGLKSTSANNYLITSVTADLNSASEGFGAQVATVAQSTGGPLTSVSPYSGASQNVGIIDSTYRTILDSAGAITAGRAAIYLKVKTANITPAAADYSETLTVIAAAKY